MEKQDTNIFNRSVFEDASVQEVFKMCPHLSSVRQRERTVRLLIPILFEQGNEPGLCTLACEMRYSQAARRRTGLALVTCMNTMPQATTKFDLKTVELSVLCSPLNKREVGQFVDALEQRLTSVSNWTRLLLNSDFNCQELVWQMLIDRLYRHERAGKVVAGLISEYPELLRRLGVKQQKLLLSAWVVEVARLDSSTVACGQLKLLPRLVTDVQLPGSVFETLVGALLSLSNKRLFWTGQVWHLLLEQAEQYEAVARPLFSHRRFVTWLKQNIDTLSDAKLRTVVQYAKPAMALKAMKLLPAMVEGKAILAPHPQARLLGTASKEVSRALVTYLEKLPIGGRAQSLAVALTTAFENPVAAVTAPDVQKLLLLLSAETHEPQWVLPLLRRCARADNVEGVHQKALKATALRLLSDGARPWKKFNASLDTTYGC